jgi:membrane protein required for colicin V production
VNILDIVLAALAALIAIRAALRGFVQEVMAVGALILGLIAAFALYRPLEPLFASFVGEGPYTAILSFIGVFAAAFILAKIVESLVRGIVRELRLEGLDKLLGLLVGLVEAFLLGALILVLLSSQDLVDVGELLSGSAFARAVLPLVADYDLKALGDEALRLVPRGFDLKGLVPASPAP